MKEAFYKNEKNELIEINSVDAYNDVNNLKIKQKNNFICESCKEYITITHTTNQRTGFITPYFAARGTQAHKEDCEIGITSKNLFKNNRSRATVNFGKRKNIDNHPITDINIPIAGGTDEKIKKPIKSKKKAIDEMSSKTFFNHAEYDYNTVITKVQKSNFMARDYNNGEIIPIQDYFVYPHGNHLKFLKSREFRIFNGHVDYYKYKKNDTNYIRVTFEWSKSKRGNYETYFDLRENSSFKNIYNELDFNLSKTKQRYENTPLRTGCFIRGKLNYRKFENKYYIAEATNIWICNLY